MSKALEKHVPAGVAELLDERYQVNDEDAFLDVFYPAHIDQTAVVLPTIVWVHGGAWVSGDKAQIANYLRILASKGYTVVGVGYSIAPRKIYPTPLTQINTALAYLQANAQRLHIDSTRLYLAGDSAGAQIAAQLANIISSPSYAQNIGIYPSVRATQMRGVLLYCGAYDLDLVRLDGLAGVFLEAVLWSYTGTKDFLTDTRFASASVVHFVSPAFPQTFISVGNKDPLAAQSYAMAEALAVQKVPVDALFFSKSDTPSLAHEYQFNLDTEAGQQALARSLRFLASAQ